MAAGLLLTGGASRRMGVDKATLAHPDDGEPLARRVATRLARATRPTLEVGPGHTHFRAVLEDPPGSGPLAAMAAGGRALEILGWSGPVVVVATDLPRVNVRLLAWLAAHPSRSSIVPVAAGAPQPLCARYSADDMKLAAELTRGGARAMRDLLAAIDALLVGPDQWGPAAGDPLALADADTPADLAALRGGPPATALE